MTELELSYEEDAMRAELEWVIKDEVPAVFAQLGMLMKKCIRALDEPFLESNSILPPATPPAKRADSNSKGLLSKLSSSDGRCYGSIRIEGCSVIGGDITVLVPDKSNSLHSHSVLRQSQTLANVKIDLFGKQPWALSQVIEARLFLSRALEEIDASSKQHGLLFSCAQLSHVTDSIIFLLKSAKDRFELPACVPLPMLLGYMASVVKAPPADILLEFSIKQAQLVTRCYLINDVGPTQGNARVPASTATASVGNRFSYRERCFEVTGISEAVNEIDLFTDSLACINSLLDLAQRLQDKIRAFSAIGDKMII